MTELPKAYEAEKVDEKWYQFWFGSRFFEGDPQSSKPPFCVVMPPPNVTGVLHMGHALVTTLQDIIVRWKRMSGYEVLWVPGTDHAGISTQTVVERHLMRTQGKTRKEYTREEFVTHIWQWKVKSESSILDQLKRLGSSCDWSRLRFTMDEGNNQAVRTMFKKLYDAGLIYQGDYLVNWDPLTQTALADDEVEYEERSSFLWHIKYPLEDGSGYITVATTRPETMLGDTAVAVSPSDSRYAHVVGKQIKLPLVNRLIPIIADHTVDSKFGTGAVKVTPAHDHDDYQRGIEHKLPLINIMTPDGRINENGGSFAGLTMPEARTAVVDSLKQLGLLAKVEPHTNRVGLSYRSKAVIEPYLSKQWFVRMENFRKQLRDVVQQGKVKLIPQHWESTYFHWIDHLRDWCISRQLWWGHQIPIWHHKQDPKRKICYDGEGIPPEVAQDSENWVQDHDVLDTWFSSALWPFSTLGWPYQTEELKRFYPNSVLITGHDILFFWVARMIFMGQYAMGEPPFPATFLHGLIYGKSYWRELPEGGIRYVQDEERLQYDLGKPTPPDVISRWEKMSKSKGNIIDPLEMIDQYGTDAIRMSLCASATQARQIDLDRRRFEEFKNFANKVWNGARFILMNLNGVESELTFGLDGEAFSQGLDLSLLALEDRWILSVLNRTIQGVAEKLANYQFDQAALQAYDFYWKDFCAYYLETAKPVLFGKAGSTLERLNKQKLLVIALCQAVRLLHPMAPFITEEIFYLLKQKLIGAELIMESDAYTQECVRALHAPACMVAPFPTVINPEDTQQEIEDAFDLMQQVVYTIRNIRGEMNLSPGVATHIYIIGSTSDPEWHIVKDNTHLISALVKSQKIDVLTHLPELGFACTGLIHGLKIFLPLPQEMIEQERGRLTKEQAKVEASLAKLQGQLANEEFVKRAPEALIEKQRQQVVQAEADLAEIQKKLRSL